MANGTGEVHIPVFGNVATRPTGDHTAEWQLVAETPGAFTPRPGEAYRFEFMGIPDVRDPDLEQLVDALVGTRATAVKALALSGSPVTARAVRRLTDLPWLESLDAYRMTDPGMDTIGKLTELRRLHLDTSDVTDRGLAKIVGLAKLTDLSLACCPITDAGVEVLARFPTLTNVKLDGCHMLGDRAARTLAALPNLCALGLGGCYRLTDRGLSSLATMPKLTYLGLARNGGFLLRLLRRFGVVGDTEVGSFSESAVQRVRDAHPDCDIWQSIDWAAVNRS